MNIYLKHLYIILGFALAGFIAFKLLDRPEPAPAGTIKTDSVHVKEVHHWHETNNNTSTKVIIQEKNDTSYRKQAEKETIITGVKIKPGEVDIQKVDSAGVVTEEHHKIDEGSTITINNNGVNEKKRTKAGTFLRKAGKVGLRTLEVIGAVAIIIIATK